LYPDKRIQHAGVILGIDGVAGHSHRFVNEDAALDHFDFPNVTTNYSAVTGACLMIRRRLFAEFGGLDEDNLPVAYNDLDLCLRLREAGYLIVYTPYALLYHKESASRGYAVNRAEVSYVTTKWENEILNDPYYNPNLTLEREDFSIDFSKPEAFFPIGVEEELFNPLSDIYEGIHVGRKILMQEENLCGIGLKFGKSPHSRKGTVVVRLRTENNPATDLRLASVDASVIKDHEYQVLTFDPIPDSKDASYYVIVEYVKRQAQKRSKTGKASDVAAPGGYRENPLFLGSMLFRAFSQQQFRCSFDGDSMARPR